jgi:hypothetical protein
MPMSSRTEQAKTYDLDDKPFAKALLLRASEYQDKSIHDYRMVGGNRPLNEHTTLEQFAASCAATVAYHVTTRAMMSIGKNLFVPYQPVPADAPVCVAFSLYVLAAIHNHLETEGIKLDFDEVTVRTTNNFYLLHRDNEAAEHIITGIKVFQSLTSSDHENATKWHDNLTQLMFAYVLQWTTDNLELKKQDFVQLFGNMLSSLLKGVQIVG